MTFTEFDRYQAEILEQVLKMRDTKGREYANSESRFANFDRLATKLNISRLKVAQVYYTKHLDALESYIDKGQTYSTEGIHGRIVDLITYITLVGGMIKDGERAEHIWIGDPKYCSQCKFRMDSLALEKFCPGVKK